MAARARSVESARSQLLAAILVLPRGALSSSSASLSAPASGARGLLRSLARFPLAGAAVAAAAALARANKHT